MTLATTAHDEHVLVTGGAGAIGAAFARVYRERNPTARCSLVDIDEAGASRVARELGRDAWAARWDLSVPDSLPEHYEVLVRERGPVDVLVNCAGIMEMKSLAATSWELGSRLLRIDLESPLRLMSLAVPSMKERRRGLIINVSSMAGRTPIRGCAYYGAAKAGLAMASEIARAELAADGIHVLTVYPGPVHSELERRARAQLPATALTRLAPTGDPEELAARMVDACAKKRARVVYPAFYDVANLFPGIAGLATSAFSPVPTDA